MGFIYTGSGFKRRNLGRPIFKNTVALPSGRPSSDLSEPEKFHNFQHFPRSGSAPPTLEIENAASACIEHPTNLEPRNNNIDSELAQIANFYNETALPLWQNVHVTPTFVNLPAEILFRIYCCAGVGPHNAIASTCSYLYGLFDYTRNCYFFEMLVRTHFVLKLDAGSSIQNWQEKFQKRLAALPPSFNAGATADTAFLAPLAAVPAFTAIDSQVFTLAKIDENHVKFLKSRFGGICVDRTAADRQRKLRRRFFEWKYMVLKKFVVLATEAFHTGIGVNSTPQSVLVEAEGSEACVQFYKTHELEKYSVSVESADIPREVFRSVNSAKLVLVRALVQEYDMRIAHPALLVSSFFAQNGKIWTFDDLAVEELFQLVAHNLTATAREIADALTVFDECRHRLFSLPLEEREAHPMSRAVGRYYEYLKEILTYYYETHPEDNSSVIWELLKQIEIPELLDHVVGLGVNVPLHMF